MIGNSVALDTNQAIAILNDDPSALSFYATFGEICLPVTVLGELRYGALNSRRIQENLDNIARLAIRCRLLAVDDATATRYARLRMALKKLARPIPENDLWIAAACDQHALPLATLDSHFSVVPGLTLLARPLP